MVSKKQRKASRFFNCVLRQDDRTILNRKRMIGEAMRFQILNKKSLKKQLNPRWNMLGSQMKRANLPRPYTRSSFQKILRAVLSLFNWRKAAT